jgi:hypothetical protein
MIKTPPEGQWRHRARRVLAAARRGSRHAWGLISKSSRKLRGGLEAKIVPVICSLALVIITGVYTHYARQQALAAIDASKATAQQLADFEIVQRASLSTEVAISPDKKSLLFDVTNHGQVAARNIVICGEIAGQIPHPPTNTLTALKPAPFRIWRGDATYIPQGSTDRFATFAPPANVDLSLFDNGGFLIVGRTVYFDDGFGKRISALRCSTYARGQWTACAASTASTDEELQRVTPGAPPISSLRDTPANCK